MGFLDFIFGKKKDEQTKQSVCQTVSDKQASKLASQKIIQSQAGTLPPTITPFAFKSDCHQRYENGSEVMGLQQCIRTVSVERCV